MDGLWDGMASRESWGSTSYSSRESWDVLEVTSGKNPYSFRSGRVGFHGCHEKFHGNYGPMTVDDLHWLISVFFCFFRWFSSLQAVIIAKGYLQWTYHFKPKHGYNEQQMFLFFQVELLRFKIYVPPTRDFDPASENCTLRDLCRFAASCLCHKLGEPQPLSTGLQAFKQNFKPGQLGIKMYK